MADTGLFVRSWEAAGAPVAYVLLVHGYAEHSGRYGELAAALTTRGIAVHAYDQPGHGQSPGKRGYVARFDGLVGHLEAQLATLAAVAGPKPIFIFAHSMGGLVATNYLTQHPGAVAGAIISSPLLAIPENVSPMLLKMAGILGAWLPWLPVDRLDSQKISRDPREVAAYDQDPLVYHGPICARTGAELTAAIPLTNAHLDQIDVPLLVLHGEADQLAPPAGGHGLIDHAGSEDKSAHFQADGYHELLKEDDREAIQTLIGDWIIGHITGDGT